MEKRFSDSPDFRAGLFFPSSIAASGRERRRRMDLDLVRERGEEKSCLSYKFIRKKARLGGTARHVK